MRRRIMLAALPAVLATAPLPAQHRDIVRTAQSAGQFSTLLAAVDAAGLTATLKGRGPFTVFAPTDEAFAKLPAGTVESLLRPENREQLKAILLYHVVSGRVAAATARGLDAATTVEGRDVRIRTERGALRINDATVIGADVQASNGVIHVIDAVLLPPASPDRMELSAGVQSARDLIDLAIARGVPLFNDGQPAATSAIYEVAARGVLALGSGVPAEARRALERGLRTAAAERDVREQAWALRRALDQATTSLDGSAALMMSRRTH
jgi:uncharacterized surface protein with fasciclin (FAS1) repeats